MLNATNPENSLREEIHSALKNADISVLSALMNNTGMDLWKNTLENHKSRLKISEDHVILLETTFRLQIEYPPEIGPLVNFRIFEHHTQNGWWLRGVWQSSASSSGLLIWPPLPIKPLEVGDGYTRTFYVIASRLSLPKVPDPGSQLQLNQINAFMKHLTDSLSNNWAWGSVEVKAQPYWLKGAAGGVRPSKPARNFGRENLVINWAKRAVSDDSLRLLVSGHPGIGKSTFTSAISTHAIVQDAFGDSRWWVDLQSAWDASGFQSQIALAIGLPSNVSFAVLLGRLRERPGLLELDNLETPLNGNDAQSVIRKLQQLNDVKGLRLIASVRGEQVPNDIEWERETLITLDDDDSAKLFLYTARQHAPRCIISSNNKYLLSLLEVLAGLPLAVVLVAHRLADGSTMERLWEDWNLIGAELAKRPGARNAQDSLIISIELSLFSSKITKAGIHLYKFLGFCPSGLSFDDADNLMKTTVDADDPIKAVQKASNGRAELTLVGLARGENNRLYVLPPVRDHAFKLKIVDNKDGTQDAEEKIEFENRWAEYFLQRVNKEGNSVARLGGEGMREHLEPDIGNIDAAFRTVISSTKFTTQGKEKLHFLSTASTAISGYARMARLTGLGSCEVIDEVAQELKKAEDLTKRSFGSGFALVFKAEVLMLRSRHKEAKDSYNQAKYLFENSQERIGLGLCEYGYGDIKLEHAEYNEAQSHYQHAMRYFNQTDAPIYQARCISRRGQIAFDNNKIDLAEKLYKDALARFEVEGELSGVAACLFRLGETARGRGLNILNTAVGQTGAAATHETAIAYYQRCRDLAQTYGLPLIEMNAIKGMADVALAVDRLDDARKGYRKSCVGYHDLGAVGNEGNGFRGLGDVDERAGDLERAREFWRKAAKLYCRIKDYDSLASIFERLERISSGKTQRVYKNLAIRMWKKIKRYEAIEAFKLTNQNV